jgi:hypothetical protein
MVPLGPQFAQVLIGDVLSSVLYGVVSNAVFAVLATLYVRQLNDRRKYAGRWRVTIHWTKEWERFLFGQEVCDPHSVGEVALSYGAGSKADMYWGMGHFTLRADDKAYARVCVAFEDVVLRPPLIPFFGYKLKGWVMRSEFRKKELEFSYGKWVYYTVAFDSVTPDRLEGRMMIRPSENMASKHVGDIIAERLH